jgi:hypothetical protein
MEGSPRYCFCSAGQPPWPAHPADRYCGLCGRELLAVLPRAPVLTAGEPVVAAYLRPYGTLWAGRLRLDLSGLPLQEPEVRWVSLTSPPLHLTGRVVSPTEVELSLRAPLAGQPVPGPLGQLGLAIAGNGRPFPLLVKAFGISGRPRARLTLRPGQRQAGRVLLVERGERRARTFLELGAGRGVPVQLDAVSCDHRAVSVRLLHPGRARAPAVAEVLWDAAFLADGEERVVFRLGACGLPEVVHRQRVRREAGRPVRFQPGALLVDCLAEDGPQTRLVRLTNEDARPVVIRAVEADAGWMAAAALPSQPPLRLAPGASTTLRLDLHLKEFNGVPPPYRGEVALVLEGRARQTYPVHIEAVRSPRRLASPLLLDPGPPRVVLARWDEGRRRLVYLRCSGDGGVTPDELGLDRREYAAGVYGSRPAHGLLHYLLPAALARGRLRDLLDFESVRLCGHPWVPADFEAPDVEVCDWAALARTRLCRDGLPPSLLRLDLWDAYLCEGAGLRSLLEPAERAQSLGAVLVRWLARQFVAGLKRRGAPVPGALEAAAETGLAPEAGWLRLACEALVLDCAWGPVYAWRRLLRACRAALPGSARLALDLPAAHRQLVRAVADSAQQVCLALARLGAGEGPAGLAVLGPLCRGPLFRGVLRSIFTSAGFATEIHADPWVAWLAPAEAAAECGARQGPPRPVLSTGPATP